MRRCARHADCSQRYNHRNIMSLRSFKLLGAMFLAAFPATAWAQEEEVSSIHWAYSTYFGRRSALG